MLWIRLQLSKQVDRKIITVKNKQKKNMKAGEETTNNRRKLYMFLFLTWSHRRFFLITCFPVFAINEATSSLILIMYVEMDLKIWMRTKSRTRTTLTFYELISHDEHSWKYLIYLPFFFKILIIFCVFCIVEIKLLILFMSTKENIVPDNVKKLILHDQHILVRTGLCSGCYCWWDNIKSIRC